MEMDGLGGSGTTDGSEYMKETSWPIGRLPKDNSGFNIQDPSMMFFQVDDGKSHLSP